MLALAIFFNSFIIVYSCLSNGATNAMAKPFNDFFTNIVNIFTHKDIKVIPLKKIDVSLSNEQSYVYNYIPGYKVDEIPLGSAKQIECTFDPVDATDKAVTYSASPNDAVILNQTGSLLSVVGMKECECTITATSNDGGFVSSTTVTVVKTIPPTSYEISLDSYELSVGTPKTISFDIDGGVLTHNELINFRYYDIRKLTYISSDKSIAEVTSDGVIYPKSIGHASITISNKTYSKSIDIDVVDGVTPTPYTSLSISGSNICYGNDMILDQTSHKHHYQLTPMDKDVELDPNDFIWKSENELLVKVDRHGVMRGFRKSIMDDEVTIIKAISKLTGQEASMEVIVKNQLPNNMTILFNNDEAHAWNPSEYTAMVGDIVKITIYYSPSTQMKDIDVISDNPEVVSVTNEGASATLHINKEGTCNVKITSVVNPDLVFNVNITVMKAGAININNYDEFVHYIRKSIGHALVFLVAQVFTYLTLYMFLYNQKWWFYSSISLGIGVSLAGLSELIQLFVPTRGGAWLDVLIDSVGVIVGALLTFLVIFIIKKIKSRKHQK